MTAIASADLARWIGKTETVTDSVTATPYAALSATLDRAPERPPVGQVREDRQQEVVDRLVDQQEVLDALGELTRVPEHRQVHDASMNGPRSSGLAAGDSA